MTVFDTLRRRLGGRWPFSKKKLKRPEITEDWKLFLTDIKQVATEIVQRAHEEGANSVTFPFCVEISSGLIFQWQTLGEEGVLIKSVTPELQSELRKMPWPVFQQYFKLYDGSHSAVLGSIADPDEGAPIIVSRKPRR